MNNLYDILEICLDELDNGTELENILIRYPDQAAELRPMLQAALTAKLVAVPAPSLNILNRNQAKVLQRFDQILDAKPATRKLFPSLRLGMVAFGLLLVFLFSGTNLVRASFKSLPGDGLYPVKRSWENTILFFTFDVQAHENLELKYQAERLKEINQLFASGRTAQVEFVGVLTLQHEDEWQVADISVIVSTQTDLPDQAIHNGDLVRVFGTTRGNGIVSAERIELITANTLIPNLIETQQPEVTSQLENGNTDIESETEAPVTQALETASPTSTPKIESFEGILVSMDQNIWEINMIFVEAGSAEIKGIPVIGATVKAEGYYGTDNIFIASKLEIINTDLNSNTNSNSSGGNVIINSNTNTDDNSNGGGDDNSGNGSDDKGGGHGNGG